MRRCLVGGICAALLLMPLLPPAAADAAEYEMSTVARYVVDPAGGEIGVTVEVSFTNTLPNPSGQVSAFTHVDLAIQDGASQVAAADDGGALHVDIETRDGVRVASVTTRSRVGYNQSVSFTLSYRLADGAAPGLHVRADVVTFAAWGFGTSSQVTVQLPAGYDARADGNPMETDQVGARVELSSGPIADPSRWLALVTAVLPGDYVTQSASVALASGTVDLQVRAWSSDASWGDQTLALLADALPRLEEAIGLPYPRVGPLVVTEAAGGEPNTGGLPSATAEIRVAFDGSAFTLLHQAAHIWISDQLAADRWVREGLASHYAADVAAQIGIEPPYDPADRASQLAVDARPLLEWLGGPVHRPTPTATPPPGRWSTASRPPSGRRTWPWPSNASSRASRPMTLPSRMARPATAGSSRRSTPAASWISSPRSVTSTSPTCSAIRPSARMRRQSWRSGKRPEMRTEVS